MQIHFKFAYFSFFPYSCGIETINAFIHSCSFENHTQFQTKMGQVYTRFRSTRCKNPTRWGRHIGTYLYGLYKGISPPPHPRASNTVQSRLTYIFVTINPQFTFSYLTSHNQRQWGKRT